MAQPKFPPPWECFNSWLLVLHLVTQMAWLMAFLLCCQNRKKKKSSKLFPEYFQQLVCVGQQNWWQDSFQFSCGHPSILLILCQKWCGMVCVLARRIELVKKEGLTESKWPKIFLWRTCFCCCSVHKPDVTCIFFYFLFILFIFHILVLFL